MAFWYGKVPPFSGVVDTGKGQIPLDVIGAMPHSLLVLFSEEIAPADGAQFNSSLIYLKDAPVSLGRCCFMANLQGEIGEGRLVFLDNVYDFQRFFSDGSFTEIDSRFQQVPLLLSHKDNIRPAFRSYTADLRYDLQVYRAFFEEVDRNLADEPPETRSIVQQRVIDSYSREFHDFFDRGLVELERQVRGFTKQEHERHGFYFRKQVWDIILASEFLTRTNLRPRGYAGDSIMMQQIYENTFQGPTIFSMLMHKHPIESAAAQAVRHRRRMIRRELENIQREFEASGLKEPLQIMSLACGPAWELRDLFSNRENCEKYACTLLDQDVYALAEARQGIQRLERQMGASIRANYIRDSVRTMLRTPHLDEKWGQFHFLYSMGLFDYLTQPVAMAVLHKVWELLLPGGKMIIGNFHAGNPTRTYMEYWMDWVLFYRKEEGFLQLAKSLPGAQCQLTFEDTHSQMFLLVQKLA